MINNSSSTSAGATKFSQCVNGKVDLVANNATDILAARFSRVYAAFVNNGSTDITLVLEDKSRAVLGSGIIIKGGGGSFEITQSNLYTGKVSAVSGSSTQLSFVEGFE